MNKGKAITKPLVKKMLKGAHGRRASGRSTSLSPVKRAQENNSVSQASRYRTSASSGQRAIKIHDGDMSSRYSTVNKAKSNGATYTPSILANFVASRIADLFAEVPRNSPVKMLDPAVGDGELLICLLEQLASRGMQNIEVFGFDTDKDALGIAAQRIGQRFSGIKMNFRLQSFLDHVLEKFGGCSSGSLWCDPDPETYDVVIANPPYVRTQIMGSTQTRLLKDEFGLCGRIDLCHAFILAIAQVLKPDGISAIIVSNRFMSTRSGASVRQALLERFRLRHVWDLGDTKCFSAAVLPAVLLMQGKNGHRAGRAAFTTIYETSQRGQVTVNSPVAALDGEGIIDIEDGRHFLVKHGTLDTSGTEDGVWHIATEVSDKWLAMVNAHSWGTFERIGRVRVGVKTCADKVFIKNNWRDMPEANCPELLRKLTTHHVARRFKPLLVDEPYEILYPHETANGHRRIVELERHPNSRTYLEANRAILENRKYVVDAGRAWYEIWVPQDPSAWRLPKLVFRDIAEDPTFWIDLDGTVVNGDCYWLICEDAAKTDLLWLAVAVGNSTFIEQFYDRCFNNKLYAGRRRFISQYVEKFPLPDPDSLLGKTIIATSKRIYDCTPSGDAERLGKKVDAMVWEAFGLSPEKVCG